MLPTASPRGVRSTDRNNLLSLPNRAGHSEARTIADLDDSQEIRAEHVQEAINYRMLDRQIWT